MFKVMTDGLVFSKHETLVEAEASMASVRAEMLAEVESLREQLEQAEAEADSFSIV